MQEEVEGEDGAGEAQDQQEQELEPGEATNIIEDLLKPHGDGTEAVCLRLSVCLSEDSAEHSLPLSLSQPVCGSDAVRGRCSGRNHRGAGGQT